jgi:hypothetical protein
MTITDEQAIEMGRGVAALEAANGHAKKDHQ